MKILSINISEPKKIVFNGKELITSIYKKPIDKSVELTDFGIVGDQQADLKVHGGYDKAVYAYEQWGFTDITRRKLEVLNKWAQFVYAPLMQDKKQKIQENESGVYGANVASEVHKELRKIGGIRPPREFVFMDRAAVGLGSIFMHLKAELNWYRIFNELIDGFSIKDVDIRQQKTLKNAKLYL